MESVSESFRKKTQQTPIKEIHFVRYFFSNCNFRYSILVAHHFNRSRKNVLKKPQWYINCWLGISKIGSNMTEISTQAQPITIYTNHCPYVRAILRGLKKYHSWVTRFVFTALLIEAVHKVHGNYLMQCTNTAYVIKWVGLIPQKASRLLLLQHASLPPLGAVLSVSPISVSMAPHALSRTMVHQA